MDCRAWKAHRVSVIAGHGEEHGEVVELHPDIRVEDGVVPESHQVRGQGECVPPDTSGAVTCAPPPPDTSGAVACGPANPWGVSPFAAAPEDIVLASKLQGAIHRLLDGGGTTGKGVEVCRVGTR